MTVMTFRLHEQIQVVNGVEHCANYDPDHTACRQCPGRAVVYQRDGQVDIICRAGEAALRALLREMLPVIDRQAVS